MLTFDGTCPYCLKEVVFNGIAVMPVDTSIFEINPPYKPEVAVFAQCPYCYGAVIGIVKNYVGNFYDLREKVSSEASYSISVSEIIPPVSEIFSHVSIPEKVNTAFVEAQKAFRFAKKSYYLVIAGCRTTLELAIKELTGKEKIKLFDAIDELVEKCIIPKPMGEWAHSIRVLGNEAVHEAEGSKEEAEELMNFTRLFLEYVFVMSYKLNTFRKH